MDWLCASKWCREVEGSTTYFYREVLSCFNFCPNKNKTKQLLFPRLPLTWPSPCSPQGSDSGRSRASSGLVWYVSICLIWSVHLSGLSGPIRVPTAADLRSHPQLQVAFWDACNVSALSSCCFVYFLFRFCALLLSGRIFTRVFWTGKLLLRHLHFPSRRRVEQDVSCTSRRPLSPVESGSVGLRARMMHARQAAVSSSRTVRRYEAVRTTSEPHADSVPQSFVPLH